jgi:hypothetical protein
VCPYCGKKEKQGHEKQQHQKKAHKK